MGSGSAAALSAEALLQELRTARFGRSLRLLAEVRSTIDVAWDWMREGGPHGAAVIAERQTRGRGRHGRPWASPHGGLWMSILVRPSMGTAGAGRLGIGLALAAAEAIHSASGVPAGVKWPNDLVVEERKLGGALVGTEAVGEEIGAAVLSLGVNVNMSLSELPASVRQTATTLLEESGRRHAVGTLAGRILGQLEDVWPTVVGEGAELAERWRRHDVLAGRELSVETAGETARGMAMGIDGAGALVLMAAGGLRTVSAGDAILVKDATR
jgi:BirA family biotin operon repressor/biotin-[acetyl-CoA-carboxylase] ligase